MIILYGNYHPGSEYDIFISYRQKNNKGDKWVSEFFEADFFATRSRRHEVTPRIIMKQKSKIKLINALNIELMLNIF
jgi:hypothetical protein